MTKILMCRDIGVDCDVVFEGETDDEIMEKVGQHASSAHNLPNMPPNLEKKSREAIKEKKRKGTNISYQKAIYADKKAIYADKVLSMLGQAVVVFDAKGMVTYLNPHANVLLDVLSVDVVKKNIDKVLQITLSKTLPLEDGIIAKTVLQLRKPFSASLYKKTFFLTNASGRQYPVSLVVTPISFGGASEGGIAIFRDITSEEETRAELELAKNKSETLLASIGEGVFGIDKERNIVYFNPQAEVLSGYKASEVIGKPYYDFLKFIKEKDGSENIEFIRTALKGGIAEMTGRTVLIRKDKRELPVADSASPIKDKEGNILGAIVVFRDATKERELEIARAELVSFASHQLKAPLTYMGWNVETLKESKSEEESKKIVDEIDKSIEDMKKLVLDILNISRIEQGTIKLKPEPTQLVDIVGNILKESSSAIKQLNITVEFTKPTQPLPELNVDPQYTHEIFKNIISNAIKYTKDTITMSLEKKDDTILFTCSNNGIGIPKDEQSKIFSKFYVGSNVAKTGIKGTGIGLSIAKALVERMNGKIWFESEENKETTFYISLPFFT